VLRGAGCLDIRTIEIGMIVGIVAMAGVVADELA
jgi:hypothetical protein